MFFDTIETFSDHSTSIVRHRSQFLIFEISTSRSHFSLWAAADIEIPSKVVQLPERTSFSNREL